MKPTMEKMTNPANMLVQELMQHTMIASLKREHQWGGKKKRNAHHLPKRTLQCFGCRAPTCRRRCWKSCSFPVRWASPGPVRMKRRFASPHPATPVGKQSVGSHVCLWRCAGWLDVDEQAVNLRSDELIEVWSDVEENPIDGSRECDPSEEQDEQHEVGIGGGEIHHLQGRELKIQWKRLKNMKGNTSSEKQWCLWVYELYIFLILLH